MNTAKLKAAAEKATPGKWWIDSHGSAMVSFTGNGMKTIFVTDGKAMGKAVRHQDTGNLSHWRNDNDATFIATANPATVLELIAALEAKDAQIAELLEKQRLIDICQGQGLEHRIAAERRAEAAEKRVAELERQSIQPLPIGELINRLEEQTGEPWGEVYLAGINLETGGE